MTKNLGNWTCSQCGRPGIPYDEFTELDARYTIGRCTGDHKGKQYLVREYVQITPKKKRTRGMQMALPATPPKEPDARPDTEPLSGLDPLHADPNRSTHWSDD